MTSAATTHRVARVVFQTRTVTCTCGWSGRGTAPDEVAEVYAAHRKTVGVRPGQMSNILADGTAIGVRPVR